MNREFHLKIQGLINETLQRSFFTSIDIQYKVKVESNKQLLIMTFANKDEAHVFAKELHKHGFSSLTNKGPKGETLPKKVQDNSIYFEYTEIKKLCRKDKLDHPASALDFSDGYRFDSRSDHEPLSPADKKVLNLIHNDKAVAKVINVDLRTQTVNGKLTTTTHDNFNHNLERIEKPNSFRPSFAKFRRNLAKDTIISKVELDTRTVLHNYKVGSGFERRVANNGGKALPYNHATLTPVTLLPSELEYMKLFDRTGGTIDSTMLFIWRIGKKGEQAGRCYIKLGTTGKHKNVYNKNAVTDSGFLLNKNLSPEEINDLIDKKGFCSIDNVRTINRNAVANNQYIEWNEMRGCPPGNQIDGMGTQSDTLLSRIKLITASYLAADKVQYHEEIALIIAPDKKPHRLYHHRERIKDILAAIQSKNSAYEYQFLSMNNFAVFIRAINQSVPYLRKDDPLLEQLMKVCDAIKIYPQELYYPKIKDENDLAQRLNVAYQRNDIDRICEILIKAPFNKDPLSTFDECLVNFVEKDACLKTNSNHSILSYFDKRIAQTSGQQHQSLVNALYDVYRKLFNSNCFDLLYHFVAVNQLNDLKPIFTLMVNDKKLSTELLDNGFKGLCGPQKDLLRQTAIQSGLLARLSNNALNWALETSTHPEEVDWIVSQAHFQLLPQTLITVGKKSTVLHTVLYHAKIQKLILNDETTFTNAILKAQALDLLCLIKQVKLKGHCDTQDTIWHLAMRDDDLTLMRTMYSTNPDVCKLIFNKNSHQETFFDLAYPDFAKLESLLKLFSFDVKYYLKQDNKELFLQSNHYSDFLDYIKRAHKNALRHAFDTQNRGLFNLLLVSRFDINLDNAQLNETLKTIMAEKQFEYIEDILENGVEILNDSQKNTLFTYLCKHDQFALAEKLLDKMTVVYLRSDKEHHFHTVLHTILTSTKPVTREFFGNVLAKVEAESASVFDHALQTPMWYAVKKDLALAAAFIDECSAILSEEDLNYFTLHALKENKPKAALQTLNGVRFNVINDPRDESLLYQAILKHAQTDKKEAYSDACAALCNHGASLITKHKQGKTPIELLVEQENVDLIIKLKPFILQQCNDSEIRTVIALLAKRTFTKDAVDFIIGSSIAELPQYPNNKETLLHLVIKYAQTYPLNTEVTAALCEKITDITAQNESGESAVILAVKLGLWEHVDIFLNHPEKLTKDDCISILLVAAERHTALRDMTIQKIFAQREQLPFHFGQIMERIKSVKTDEKEAKLAILEFIQNCIYSLKSPQAIVSFVNEIEYYANDLFKSKGSTHNRLVSKFGVDIYKMAKTHLIKLSIKHPEIRSEMLNNPDVLKFLRKDYKKHSRHTERYFDAFYAGAAKNPTSIWHKMDKKQAGIGTSLHEKKNAINKKKNRK